MREYRKRRPEAVRAAYLAFVERHPDYWKQWHAKNRDRRNANTRAHHKAHQAERRAYRAANPDLERAIIHRRRARKQRAPGACSREQLQARVAFYGGRCAYCGGPYEHIDHVIPLSRGGANWPANLRPACASCNTSKGDRTLREWQAK